MDLSFTLVSRFHDETVTVQTRVGRRYRTLGVLSVAQFIIAPDYSIVYVALPSMAGDFGLAPATAQWIISAYAVLFAGFLIIGGRCADRWGARRLFLIAVVAFGVASGIGSVAGDGAILLLARGGQGLSAAFLQPAILGLIGTTYAAGSARNVALAVWGAVGAAGLGVGVILGGLLTAVSWRLTFLVNVPLTVACGLGALAWIGATRERPQHARIPVVSSALGTSALVATALALTVGTTHGWSAATTVECLVAAGILLSAFLWMESTSDNVLVARTLRRSRSLRIGSAATALYMASVGSEFYLLTLLFQEVRDYSPVWAGLAFAPLTAVVTVGNLIAAQVMRKHSADTALAIGFATAVIGLGWLALASYQGSYVVQLLGGLLLSGVGHGIIFTSMFSIGTRDVSPAHQGIAAALLTTSQYVSAAIAVAVLTIALGDSGDLRAGFLVTTAAAVGGLVLAVSSRTPHQQR